MLIDVVDSFFCAIDYFDAHDVIQKFRIKVIRSGSRSIYDAGSGFIEPQFNRCFSCLCTVCNQSVVVLR